MAARSASTRRLTSVASGVLLTAAAVGGLALPAAAHDHSSPMPTASAEGHVHEHSHDHGAPTAPPAPAATSHSHTGHDGHTGDVVPTPVDRPRAALLGGFAAVNGAVLVGALVARRRGLAGHPPRVRRG
ncbi:MAG TPA: hypothetical protein VFR56_05340 [Actinomycetes bacterium]|nr:hypothetical protein [Actinomycetes bacterium]